MREVKIIDELIERSIRVGQGKTSNSTKVAELRTALIRRLTDQPREGSERCAECGEREVWPSHLSKEIPLRSGYHRFKAPARPHPEQGGPQESKTNRGFALVEFVDHYGVECSLQKSSLATEDAIWFGCNDADPKVRVPGKGWQSIEMPAEYNANTRMHLTLEMVQSLLPYLQHFAETGELAQPSASPAGERRNRSINNYSELQRRAEQAAQNQKGEGQ